jgi:hypothetical protein
VVFGSLNAYDTRPSLFRNMIVWLLICLVTIEKRRSNHLYMVVSWPLILWFFNVLLSFALNPWNFLNVWQGAKIVFWDECVFMRCWRRGFEHFVLGLGFFLACTWFVVIKIYMLGFYVFWISYFWIFGWTLVIANGVNK